MPLVRIFCLWYNQSVCKKTKRKEIRQIIIDIENFQKEGDTL